MYTTNGNTMHEHINYRLKTMTSITKKRKKDTQKTTNEEQMTEVSNTDGHTQRSITAGKKEGRNKGRTPPIRRWHADSYLSYPL